MTSIILPIDNLTMHIPRFRIGDVLFVDSFDHIEQASAKNLIEQIMKSKEENSEVLFIHKPYFEGRRMSIVESNINDNKQANEFAFHIVEEALNVLRFYVNGLYKRNPIYFRMYVGIVGTTYTARVGFVNVSSTGSFSLHFERQGQMYNYHIDDELVSDMRLHHYEKLDDILRKSPDSRSNFESSILAAITSMDSR
jgi:hypothetical protein